MFSRQSIRCSVVGIALTALGMFNLGTVLAQTPQANYAPITAANAKDVSALVTLKPGADSVSSISFSADGSVLASGHKDGTIHLWDTATQSETKALRGDASEGAVDYVGFGAGSTMVSLTDIDSMGLGKAIRVWDVSTGDSSVFGLKNMGVLGLGGSVVAISPDGKLIANDKCGDQIALGSDGSVSCLQAGIQVYDAQSEDQQAALAPSIKGGVLAIAFSPDSKLIAVSSGDGLVRLITAKSGQVQRTFPKLAGKPTSVAFSGDGSLLAAGVDDGSVHVWTVKTGAASATLNSGSSAVLGVAFNADGSVLASGGADTAVSLWDVKAKKKLTALKGHTDNVTSLAFTHDSTLLASGSLDGTIILWGVAR